MTDNEIRKTWAENYPAWRSVLDARLVCRMICELILWRARAETIVGDERQRINHICFVVGIPQEEYWDVKTRGAKQGKKIAAFKRRRGQSRNFSAKGFNNQS